MRLAIAWLAVVAAGTWPACAAAPKVDSLFPAGGQRGTEFEVQASGALDPWPLQASCDGAGITFTPDEQDKGKFHVKVAAEVDPGAYLVRFYNAEGATVPRQFVVGAFAERTQAGVEILPLPPGDLPLTINGKLESGGEVDRFSLELADGQWLVADVLAYAIDSPVDPLLHLLGPRGERLAFNHDATRLGLDPRLSFRAPAAGRYELQLSAFAYPPQANIRFTGGATSIYRLTLGHQPPQLDLPEPHEADGEGAQPLAIPSAISGRIDPAGDIDRYQFSAKQGETVRVEVQAAQLGSWMDALLVIEDAAGKELKRQDDIDSNTQPDVALEWTAPADGDFIAKVADLNRAGGSQIAYRLKLTQPAPGFAVTATGGSYAIRAGEKLEIAVSCARHHGYTGELEIGIDGLPAGVSAPLVAVPEKGGEVKLAVEAVTDAAPANVPITIWAAPKGAGASERVACRFELKGAFADAGDLLVNDTEQAWLTVLKPN